MEFRSRRLAHPAKSTLLLWSALPTPASPRFSIASPACAKRWRTIPASPSITIRPHEAGVGRGDLTLIDLPGIYRSTTYSEDARVAVDVFTGQCPARPSPTLSCSSSTPLHLTRQLMLAAPVLAVGLPTLVLLNMADLMEARGGKIDTLDAGPRTRRSGRARSAPPRHGHRRSSRLPHAADRRPQAPRNSASTPVLGKPPAPHWAAQVTAAPAIRPRSPRAGPRKLDNILLHRIWGPLLFLVVVIAVFQVVFSIGSAACPTALATCLTSLGASPHPSPRQLAPQSLLLDGLWNGVQSVLVFLPQILLLFLFIGVLEDSGYLARAALIADRVMRSIGLNGKAFIPLLSAYACAVPAIMATRTIENKRERLATILIAPFMTCSARLPVYTLIIAAFIPNRLFLGGVIGLRAMVMIGLYAIGFLAALLTAKLLNSTVMKASPAPSSSNCRCTAGPPCAASRCASTIAANSSCAKPAPSSSTSPSWSGCSAPPPSRRAILLLSPTPSSATSAAAIEPVLAPLGFNWKIGIGLVSSIVAREVIVGTLGTLYGVDPATHSLGPAGRPPPRHDPRRSHRPGRLLRLRHAVHVHARRRPPRNQQLEVPRAAIHLHDRRRLHRRPPHQPDHHASVLGIQRSPKAIKYFMTLPGEVVMPRNEKNIAVKIQTLSADQLAEVEDFIDFLRFRAQEREITRAAASMSEPAFRAIWVNPEDDVYDAL